MPEQTETRRVGEIVESEIGSRAYLALHVGDVQDGAGTLYEALEDEPSIEPEFRDLLLRVAQYEVRL